MSSATPSAPLDTASSSLPSPSIQDNRHNMKEQMNHPLFRKKARNYKKKIMIDIDNM